MKSLTVFCGIVLASCLLSCGVQAEKEEEVVSPQGTDCTQINALDPEASSGVYVIQPAGLQTQFKVYCEMRPDGGWTVFQRRSGGAVSFDRNWADYKDGFGNLANDHWLGLETVFSLTKSKRWTLRVDLWDHEGGTAFAEYTNFRLGNETEAYKLHVGTYRGTAGDAIRGAYEGINQNGFGFSTSDRDNDGCDPWCLFGDILRNECTSTEVGGWWYNNCGSASLNGDWHPTGDHIWWSSGLHWDTWKDQEPYSLKATRMMVKSSVMQKG